MARSIAAFDFDGTLTRRDTVFPFLVRYYGPTKVVRALARAAPAAGRARLRPTPGQLDHRDLTKAAVLREVFTGEDPSRLAEHGEDYAADHHAGSARDARPARVASQPRP